jgi:hypothetical protein
MEQQFRRLRTDTEANDTSRFSDIPD